MYHMILLTLAGVPKDRSPNKQTCTVTNYYLPSNAPKAGISEQTLESALLHLQHVVGSVECALPLTLQGLRLHHCGQFFSFLYHQCRVQTLVLVKIVWGDFKQF